MTTTPPAPDGDGPQTHDAIDWDAIRLRYEKGEEPVPAIAAAVGMSSFVLSLKAKAMGWMLRGKPKKAAKTARKSVTTRATLQRLKDILQDRITRLETELRSIGEEVEELNNERGIRSMNTLVRTLDKVLELERKDRDRRKRSTRDFKRLDDGERAALADKIERLQHQWLGEEAGADAEPKGDARAEPELAVLGEDRPADPGLKP